MTQTLIVLAAGFAGLLILLLNLGLYTRWPAWVKTLSIVLFSLLAFTHYDALRDIMGWPTHKPLPEQFVFLSAWVNEPNRQESGDGSIHIWAVEVTESGTALVPRSYALDYEQGLHRRIDDAGLRMRQGVVQIGRRTLDNAAPAQARSSRFADDHNKIEFYDLPDPELPEK